MKSKKRKNNFVNLLVPFFLIAIILFSGYKLVTSLLSYKIANDEYSELQAYAVPDTKEYVQHTEDSDVQEVIEETIDIPYLDVDYKSLREINEDYMGWLVIPALDLSYPYVKGENNEEYLHLTFEGKPSSSGTVFMDSFNYPNFRDFNTFLYAHNMKDKSMFGSLKLFGKDENLAKDNPYIYIYTPKASYRFKIFAYYITVKGSETYQMLLKPEEYDSYLKYISAVNTFSLYEDDINFDERPRLLTLSTCQGSAGTSNRFVVHAVLDGKIDME